MLDNACEPEFPGTVALLLVVGTQQRWSEQVALVDTHVAAVVQRANTPVVVAVQRVDTLAVPAVDMVQTS